jgi:hypothetical protein
MERITTAKNSALSLLWPPQLALRSRDEFDAYVIHLGNFVDWEKIRGHYISAVDCTVRGRSISTVTFQLRSSLLEASSSPPSQGKKGAQLLQPNADKDLVQARLSLLACKSKAVTSCLEQRTFPIYTHPRITKKLAW